MVGLPIKALTSHVSLTSPYNSCIDKPERHGRILWCYPHVTYSHWTFPGQCLHHHIWTDFSAIAAECAVSHVIQGRVIQGHVIKGHVSQGRVRGQGAYTQRKSCRQRCHMHTTASISHGLHIDFRQVVDVPDTKEEMSENGIEKIN